MHFWRVLLGGVRRYHEKLSVTVDSIPDGDTGQPSHRL